VLERQLSELEVHGRADQIPGSITVEIASAQAGDSIRLSDLQLPDGIEPTRDPDTVIARVTEPRVAPEVEAALEAEEAAQAALRACQSSSLGSHGSGRRPLGKPAWT